MNINKTQFRHFRHVHLTDEEYTQLLDKFGLKETFLKIKNFDEHLENTKSKYKSHFNTILLNS
jgi:hypothetical protein